MRKPSMTHDYMIPTRRGRKEKSTEEYVTKGTY